MEEERGEKRRRRRRRRCLRVLGSPLESDGPRQQGARAPLSNHSFVADVVNQQVDVRFTRPNLRPR